MIPITVRILTGSWRILHRFNPLTKIEISPPLFCIRQFPRSEISQRNRRQWNSGRILEKFLKPFGPQVDLEAFLEQTASATYWQGDCREEKRPDIKFLFLPRMGLLGSQASSEKNLGYELWATFILMPALKSYLIQKWFKYLNHSRFFLVYTGLAHRDKSLFVVMIVVGSYHILRSRLI